MSLPLFSDIGKEVKDLFEKNFFFDCVKMEMKNGLSGEMQYQGYQKYSIKDGKMSGEVEGKYETDGFTIIPKLNTESSVINYDLKVNRPELKGINLIVSGTFNPANASKSFAFGASYSGPDYNVEISNSSNDPKAQGNSMRANAVFNLFGWIFGVTGMVDPAGFKIMNTNVVGGFQDGRTSFFVNCDPQQKSVTGSVYNVVNSNIQTGIVYSLGGSSGGAAGGGSGAPGGGQPSLGFCGSYILNDGASMKARINADYMLGLAYVLKLKPGISVTMCTEIDAQKLKQGGHKMGFGVEFS